MELNYINLLSISLVGTGLIFCVRIFHKIRSKKCKCVPKLKKTVVITGATSGIGEACAKELAKRNCRLILGCRNQQLGQKVIDDIRKSNASADVKMFHLDLTDLISIKRFTESLDNERIDVLINNAGVMAGHFRMIQCTKTEEDMTVNYLGHFYLTNLLLPNLGLSTLAINNTGDNSHSNDTSRAPSRVIFISSSLSKRGRLAIDKLDLSRDSYNPMQAYANSKLALNVFAHELHHRYHQSGNINVMTLFTNGMVNTRLSRHILSTYSIVWQPFIKTLLYLLLRDAVDACHPIIHCALSDQLNRSSNELFANFNTISWPESTIESIGLSSALWSKSCEILAIEE